MRVRLPPRQGAGTADNLNAKLSFSLNQLANQLRQFSSKMDNVQLAGEGSGNLTWKRSPEHQFDAGADIQLRGFQLEHGKNPPWREDAVLLGAAAKGQTNFDAKTRVDAATLTVKSGADQIDVKKSGSQSRTCRVAACGAVLGADPRPVAELARPSGRLPAHEQFATRRRLQL